MTVNLTFTWAQATGGAGTDTLTLIENLEGSASADRLTGTTLANILVGGDGNDTLIGGGGADTLRGGAGDDLYILGAATAVVDEAGGSGIDLVQTAFAHALSAGVENLTLTGAAAVAGTGNDLDNRITGNAGANLLTGGAGNDTLEGLGGADTLSGGDGDDLYIVTTATTRILADASGTDTVRSTVAWALADDLEHLDLLGLTAISGTGNLLDNRITGNGAANLLSGGAGDDTLTGGLGNDTLIGGAGGDALDGGAGVDTASWAGSSLAVTASLATLLAVDADGTDSLAGIENLTGGAGNDVLTGDGFANVLDGGAGDDWLSGGAGNDKLIGGAGNDWASYADAISGVTVNLTFTWAQATGGAGTDTLTLIENLEGSANADRLTGSTLANILVGGDGNDTLTGGGGADTLDGGLGRDMLYGGTGADVFVFRAVDESALSEPDTIADFQLGDVIDLSTIDANGAAVDGDGSFSLSASRTSGMTGELVFMAGHLYGYVDADDTADLHIILLNRTTFGPADFLP